MRSEPLRWRPSATGSVGAGADGASASAAGGRDPAAVVAAYLACVDAERFDDLLALFAPDAELRAPGGSVRVGHEALRAYFERALRPYGEHEDRASRVVVAGTCATVDIHFRGRVRGGGVVAFDALDVFDLDADGRIARLSSWYDSARVRRLLEVAAPGGGPAAGPPPAGASPSAGVDEEVAASSLERLRARLGALEVCREHGIAVVELTDGAAVLEMGVTTALRNPGGAIPGIYPLMLSEVAASFALSTTVPPGAQHVVTSLGAQYLRAPLQSPLRARAVVQRAGRSVAFASVEVLDARGVTCLSAGGTWAVRDPRAPAAAPASLLPDGC